MYRFTEAELAAHDAEVAAGALQGVAETVQRPGAVWFGPEGLAVKMGPDVLVPLSDWLTGGAPTPPPAGS